MMQFWSKKNVFFIILILSFFIRIIGLGEVPVGLTNDEADIGYDSYSLLLTGRDQWGEFIPLASFRGFGDYRLPLYTYLVIPAIGLFDLSAFSVRLPSAIFGTISVSLIYLVSRKLFEKTEISQELTAFSAMFLMAFSPWAVGLSRIGIESNVAITFFLLALLSFLHSFKKPYLLYASFIIFALTIYTYTAYTFFTPIVIIILLSFFRQKILLYKKHVIFSCIIFIVLLAPLFLLKSAAGVRASQVTFINSPASIGLSADLNDRRGSCVEIFPGVICKIFENKYTTIGNTFIENYLSHFSPEFLYMNGTTTQYSILPQRGLLFIIEFPLLILGLIAIARKKIKSGMLVFLILVISPLPDTFTGGGHFSRAANMQPFLFLIEGIGTSYVLQIFKRKKYTYAFATFFLVIILVSSLAFLISYFSYFPKYYSRFGQYGYEELAAKLLEKQKKYDRIYISRFSNDTKQYIYYLFYNKYDPVSFQRKKDVKYSNDNGWVSIDKLNNIYFVQRLPSEKEMNEISHENILLISHPDEFPEDYEFTESIVDKNNNGIFTFVELSDYLDYLEKQKTLKENL